MKAAPKANPMDTLRQLPENKKCFDCQQKVSSPVRLTPVSHCLQGTMYCVMNFHVFVCSACAGVHREIPHKVKGISMCVFSEQELKDLAENGNAVSTRPAPEAIAIIDVCSSAPRTNKPAS